MIIGRFSQATTQDVDDAAWIGDEAYELSVTRFLERPGRLDAAAWNR